MDVGSGSVGGERKYKSIVIHSDLSRREPCVQRRDLHRNAIGRICDCDIGEVGCLVDQCALGNKRRDDSWDVGGIGNGIGEIV